LKADLRLLAPEGGVAFIAGIPDLSRIDDLPYSVAIHDIGLGGVLVAPQFRRQQEDLAKLVRRTEKGAPTSTGSEILISEGKSFSFCLLPFPRCTITRETVH
jgi:hypothetical protein